MGELDTGGRRRRRSIICCFASFVTPLPNGAKILKYVKCNSSTNWYTIGMKKWFISEIFVALISKAQYH